MFHTRALLDREFIRADDPEAPMRFVASTEGVARDGLVIEAAGWELDNYRRNPVVLWGHDYRGRLPIGRSEPFIDGPRLMADITFDPGDEFARAVRGKYERGYLNAVSVGWDPKEVKPSADRKTAPRIVRAELLDISAVSVPVDLEALKVRQLAGVRSLLESIAEERGWALVTAGADSTLTVTDVRVGAVLSTRNKELLVSARDAIADVLANAEPAEEPRSTDHDEILRLLGDLKTRLAQTQGGKR